MRIFFGGQIDKSCRGGLVAIVDRPEVSREENPLYSVFLCKGIESYEFIYLTGMGDAHTSIERMYIGISPEAGDSIARELDRVPIGTVNLRDTDRGIVTPHFLDKYPERTPKIVLKGTSRGYEVSEEA